jgi:hypothetical protein
MSIGKVGDDRILATAWIGEVVIDWIGEEVIDFCLFEWVTR